MKRSLLIFAALCAASWTSVQAAQPTVDPVFASDVVDRYANHIYYGSGATGMALVVIDGNQRVFRSFGETRPGNNQHPQLDSVIRIASLSKLMTSEMLPTPIWPSIYWRTRSPPLPANRIRSCLKSRSPGRWG